MTSWLLILMLCIHVVALGVYAFEWFSPSGLDKGNNAKGRSAEIASLTVGCFSHRCCTVIFFLFHVCFTFKALAVAVSIIMLFFPDQLNDLALFVICLLTFHIYWKLRLAAKKTLLY